MKNGKRIHSVTIKQMIDNSPDTSWLGEYSDRASSEFSIDRALDEFTGDIERGKNILQNALDYLGEQEEESEARDILADCLNEFEAYWRGREFRYFNPSFNYIDKNGHAKNLTPEDVRKYTRQDYERMERLNAGDWCFIGIAARAEYSVGSTPAPIQTITSGGLWGVESDAGNSYLTEIENEQLSELRSQLSEIGFSKRAISAAFKTIERKEN